MQRDYLRQLELLKVDILGTSSASHIWVGLHFITKGESMIDAVHKGTEISIEVIQTEELAPRVGFETRELAKNAALEDSRGYIDRRK